MSNEVIIDGCNVAECVCYQKEVHTRTEIFYNHCLETNKCCGTKDNYNCYFKQLQRAKAENDTLHITIEKLKADLSQAETSLYAWKTENEKLKNRNIELEAYFKVNEDFQKAWQELNSMHNNLQQVYQDEHCDNLKYKQALEDIRDLNNKTVKIPIITDKINEVLND